MAQTSMISGSMPVQWDLVDEANKEPELADSRLHESPIRPIHRLPDEILSSIFLFSNCSDYAQHVRDVLKLSSVCRHWREVALECPRLWTRLQPLPWTERFFDLFLERSKQAPLDVELTGYATSTESNFHMYFQHFVLPQAHRWRTCLFRSVDATKLAPFALNPTPLLEALTVEYTNARGTVYSPRSPLAPTYTPRLSILVIAGAFFPFTHPIYTNLTELALSFIRLPKTESPEGLLRALEASPLLERLRLGHCVFSCPIPPDSIDPSAFLVQLPRLRFFEIGPAAPVQVSRFILSRLAITHPAHILLKAAFHPGDDMSAFLPSRDHAQINLPTLSSAFALHIKVSTNAYHVRGYTHDHEELFMLRLGAPRELPNIFANFGTILPTLSLRSLVLCTDGRGLNSPAIVAAVADLLVRHPDITQLTFKTCDAPMMQILLDPSLCPRLECIQIERCHLSPDELVEIVERRARTKHLESESELGVYVFDSFSRLTITGCPQLEPILPVLRRCGVNIVEYEGPK
ncbi:hypothetical protein BOTBODRAFT_144507 [Botryobasidium botryosum FD-172 SS1]|uniref:F-box domain-containing protein n=1 Tax=Botryobasidium botryosum (strain FD-172 SS1) TaxID=930990 RepID=A0A067MML7_BOTB1|nr:hypothetical protein BOTBODRAFT_144507 [Botryobasidium botryosum FD-172 SS1]